MIPFWRAALLAALLAWLALPVAIVQAHAELINSNPAQGQTVAKFPTTIQLDFTEEADPASARATLFNASGEIVATGKVRGSPNSKLTLFVDLPSQPDGVYSLGWYVISVVDGHDTSGTLSFSVGLSSPKASLLPPPGSPDPAADLPSAGNLIFRGLAYMATALALGGAAFAALVWRPGYQIVTRAGGSNQSSTSDEAATLDERATGLFKALILFGSIGVIFSMMGVLIGQATQINPADTAPVWQTLLNNFGHHEGQFVWIRLLVLPLMAVLSTLLPPAGRGPARPWWEIVGLGLILELTYSLTGHDAALGSPFPVIGDWLHFTAMSFWLGGLVPLGILLLHPYFHSPSGAGRSEGAEVASGPAGAADSSATVELLECAGQHFSRMALIAVIVLGLSGIYSALLQVRTLPALVDTRYGQAILVKSGLVLALVGLGALNQRGILPRIARRGGQALHWLGQSVRVEIVLGGLALLAAGGLVSLAPAYQALQADQRIGLHEHWSGDGVSMDFRVAPVQVGDNEFAVDIVDRRPGADTVTGTTLLRIQASDESTGQVQVEARLTASHRYTARGSYLSKMTAWDVLVIWRKKGFDDVTHVFTVDLVKWAEQTGHKANPVPADPASLNGGQ